ncbi:MAG: MBL fold metallo-hydrolase [Candidatus Nezhaarchaeota archaeon]|nr:MBL fold metallo-hydrolase [Candidatus Nezhaarchaeota archaeon]
MKLRSKLYYYPETGFTSNSYIIEDGIRVLVDPGHQNHLQSLIEFMREDGLELRDIDYIIVTHAHVDHCGAVHEIQKQYDVKVAMHESEKQYMYEQSKFFLRLLGLSFAPFNVDHWFKGDESNFEGLDVLILHTPGHTPGSISIYSPTQKYLITGDLVFEGGVGRTDLGGDSSLLARSIERVSQLDVELLLPGHGPIITGASNVSRNFRLIKSFISYL